MASFAVIIKANNKCSIFHCVLYKFSSCLYTKVNMVDPIFYQRGPPQAMASLLFSIPSSSPPDPPPPPQTILLLISSSLLPFSNSFFAYIYFSSGKFCLCTSCLSAPFQGPNFCSFLKKLV